MKCLKSCVVFVTNISIIIIFIIIVYNSFLFLIHLMVHFIFLQIQDMFWPFLQDCGFFSLYCQSSVTLLEFSNFQNFPQRMLVFEFYNYIVSYWSQKWTFLIPASPRIYRSRSIKNNKETSFSRKEKYTLVIETRIVSQQQHQQQQQQQLHTHSHNLNVCQTYPVYLYHSLLSFHFSLKISTTASFDNFHLCQ